MGKISLVSAKYIIHATITVDGMVDRPDVIGSVFGQTEGLLGSELELRELQSSGRIGRIEVELKSKDGKTSGTINIPSSLDKTETALIAAAVETIERIGPCNAEVKVDMLEDVRAAKRGHVIDRAKALLSNLTHGTLPDSRDIKDKVSTAVRVADIETYGREKLPAGPDVKDSDEIIIVEGRADVVNLLKYDIKNSVAMNGTSVPKTLVTLSKKKKEVVVFLDGDRGGDLILRELEAVNAKIDYVARAPDGKEVEEITHKEIHQALRNKIKFEIAMDRLKNTGSISERPKRNIRTRERPERNYSRNNRDSNSRDRRSFSPRNRDFKERPLRIPRAQKEKFLAFMNELKGSKEAYLLDNQLNVLGKVPSKEISETMQDLGRSASNILIDGALTEKILEAAEGSRIRYLIGTKSNLKEKRSRVKILTIKDLQE